VSQKYEFIDAEYADASARAADNAPAVAQMCRWLGVSKSGFYEWRSRPESATAKRQERLKLLIKKIFDDSDSTYGYRRIARQFARQGVVAGAELVRKLMRVLGLVPCQPRPWRPSTTQQGAAGPIPDLVDRDFSAAAPGEITDRMDLARHGAHTFWGLLTRTAATIAAHTLMRARLAGLDQLT
jgi:hypothetical protein